jgi:hypothetical protein
MNPKLARAIIRLCDWMLGYRGKELQRVLIAMPFAVVAIALLMWMLVTLS